jgi:hypothetical protein
MAEVMPVVSARRWTTDLPRSVKKRAFPLRVRVVMALATLAALLAGAAAGLGAWWRPIETPQVIVMIGTPPGALDVKRSSAMRADGAAVLHALSQTPSTGGDCGLTRLEWERHLTMIRATRSHERLVIWVSAAASMNAKGEIVLLTGNVNPNDSENALPLRELLGELDRCTAGTALFLDLVPATDAMLTVVPPADLAANVAEALEKHYWERGRVFATCSPGEEARVLPGGNCTLAGWLVRKGASGAADGADGQPTDGRVSLDELQCYFKEQLPALALRMTGERQHLQSFGAGPSFELAISSTAHVTTLGGEEYPAWLHSGWKTYQATAWTSDDGQRATLLRTLREAEATLAGGITNAEEQQLKVSIERATTGFVAGAKNAPSEMVGAFTQYLAQREKIITITSPAEVKPVLQKLLTDFLKAHASSAAADVDAAVMEVATTPTQRGIEKWQAVIEVLNAWPKLPVSEQTQWLRDLTALRLAAGDDPATAEAAQLSLALVRDAAHGTCDSTWPLTRNLWDRILDVRTHGDAILFSPGFARPQDAVLALRQASEVAREVRKASRTIEEALAVVEREEQFLREHAYLAEADATAEANWETGVAALTELKTSLNVANGPVASLADLQAIAFNLSRAMNAGEASLSPLRRHVLHARAAQALADCTQAEANARDLQRAESLLRSPLVSADDRQGLWKARGGLTRKLLAAASKVQPADDGATETSLSTIAVRRQRMHALWQPYQAAQTTMGHATADEWQLWASDWQRFRAAELARVRQTPGGATWALGTLDLLGPFDCDALSDAQPTATFEMQWQERDDGGQPPTVSALSPCDALVVNVEKPSPNKNEPARFRLQLKSDSRQRSELQGFLATFCSGGRHYHAPIALPAARNDAAVNVFVSSSPTALKPLERVSLLGESTSVLVWIENNTNQQQQVAVTVNGIGPSAPLTLAPHEIQCAALPAATSQQVCDALDVLVRELPSQRVLAQRKLALFAPRVLDVVACSSARLHYDPAQGIVLSLAIEGQAMLTVPVGASLRPYAANGSDVTVVAGRTKGAMTPELPRLELSATLAGLMPGEEVRCALTVDGVREPLLLRGTVPAPGSTMPLVVEQAPSLTLQGVAATQPTSDYALLISAANPPANAELRLSLLREGVAVLSRARPLQMPPQATATATTPPGGVLLRPIVGPENESFDTSGLVGHFRWRAEVTTDGTAVASAEQPVTFDNTPPQSCRFVRPPAIVAKATIVPLQVTGWDDLTDVTEVRLFVGKLIDGKAPPTARTFQATRLQNDSQVWSAELLMPNELGACEVTAVLVNSVGLTSTITTPIDVVEKLPATVSEIRGVVVEGTLAQPNLEVTLEKTPGAVTAKAKTDEQGTFVFSGVAPGSYTVRSSKTTSQRKGQATVKVEAGATALATIKLAL